MAEICGYDMEDELKDNFYQVTNCIAEALLKELSPGCNRTSFSPYFGIGKYFQNVHKAIQQNTQSRTVARPHALQDHRHRHSVDISKESQMRERKWADEHWEWVFVFRIYDSHFVHIPFRKRDKDSYANCGALRTHFDYETFSSCGMFYKYCYVHESKLRWMMRIWLKDLDTFSISRSDCPLIEAVEGTLKTWKTMISNHTRHDDRHMCRPCQFCVMAGNEALMKWEKDADRLNILKLPAPFDSSAVGSSVGHSASFLSPLPIECGHGISLTRIDRRFKVHYNESIQSLPCLADVIGTVERPDSSSGTSICWANSESLLHFTNTSGSLEPYGATPRCGYGDSTGHRLGHPNSLDSDIMERDTILGNFQSLEEAVNTIYASTLQDDHVSSASTTTPLPSGAEVDASLIVGMSGLHIQKQKRGRAQRPSLVEDLLNPTTDSQCEDAPDNKLWTAIREANSLSPTPTPNDEEPEIFVGWRMGRQDIHMSVADSDEAVRP